MAKIKKYKIGKKLNKKAQVETQFNWIFILVAGGVILAFFTYVVIKQKANSEIKLSGKIAQQLNTILTGAKVSSGATEIIPMPDVEIRFSCNDYYIGQASQRLGNRVVYAPRFITGRKLITWTLDWNLPFKINTILYLSSPYTRFVVIGNSNNDIVKELNKTLPDTINLDFYETDSDPNLINEQDDHTRFIYVTELSPGPVPPSFIGSSVSALWVSPNPIEKNMVFLESSGSSFVEIIQLKYINYPILYGAVFTDDSSSFKCITERAFLNYNIVAQIYYEKFNSLSEFYPGSTCEKFYKENANLKSIVTSTNKTNYEDIESEYASILTQVATLSQTNQKLEYNSCPLIY
ncbi:hypothetical protein HN587_06485 [Candidatus Woesearchaeota archaeon]|jgi:hypothetical protein|nr:hypothetical protein [Candidatus Woesearchaeota archaeon]